MEECRVDGGTTASYMGGQEARATSGGVVASRSPWVRVGHIVAQQCPTGGQEDTPEVVVGNLHRGMEKSWAYGGSAMSYWRTRNYIRESY